MMKRLQVLGTGCAKCEGLAKNAQAAVGESGVEATIEKVSDMGEILSFGVPATPALVIDGAVRAVGRVPDVSEIKSWLAPISDESPSNGLAVSFPEDSEVCCCDGEALTKEEAPCCGPVPPTKDWSAEPDTAPWIIGTVDTLTARIPQVSTWR